MISSKITEQLKKLISKEKIKYNEPMNKHTSFKVGGKADIYIELSNQEEIIGIVKFLKKQNIPTHILGNGSNTLFTDEGFRGIVLKINLKKLEIKELKDIEKKKLEELRNIDTLTKENENFIITIGAGNKIMEIAQIFKQKGLTGFEELSGIPGTVGGAIKMNAGAYGKEIKDVVVQTTCIDKNGEIKILSNEEQKFSYRKSLFSNNEYIILETKLLLQKGDTKEIEEKMKGYMNSRKEKQPLEFPSAGSTFKRKEGVITAKLIDEAGLKGYTIGGAQISEKHAGFIINRGNATAKDIIDLIKYTKKKIYEKYDIEIEEEIEIVR